MNSRPLVIVHGNCMDGFTAGWIAWKHFDLEPEDVVHAAHGSDPPYQLALNRDVFVFDFSYPREKLLQLHAVANRLEVHDHHASAERDLDGLPFCTFDMTRSGAGLAWDRLKNTRRPWLVDYVEDRDLWRNSLPAIREVTMVVQATPRTFPDWSHLASRPLIEVQKHGLPMLEHMAVYCEDALRLVTTCQLDGVEFPCMNVPFHGISDALNLYLERHPEAPAVVGWHQSADGVFRISLRSRGALDVSRVAARFGGGGHPGAAGFQLDRPPSVAPVWSDTTLRARAGRAWRRLVG